MIIIKTKMDKVLDLSFSSSVIERSAGFSPQGRWKGEERRVSLVTLAELAGPAQGADLLKSLSGTVKHLI